jgi:hypothetical protein
MMGEWQAVRGRGSGHVVHVFSIDESVMKVVVVVAGMMAFAAGMFPARATAQDGVHSSIDGFNGVPWGASGEVIERKFGSPVQADTLENGIIVLAYRETLLDLPATALYALLQDRGLVKVQLLVDLDVAAGDCEGQYGRLRDYVKLSYPLIPPVESSSYPYHRDFCSAVREGAGEWATQWTDRSANSTITVIVERGTAAVKLIFESGLFRDWLGVPPPPDEDSER